MRKAELVALLQNNDPLPSQRTPEPALRDAGTWEPMDDDRKPRVPTQQEIDIFEQQEKNKIQPRVKNNLKKWYDWLIDHVLKPFRNGAIKALKTLKDKIVGLYNRATGFTAPGAGNETRLKGPKMNVDTFFNRIRKELIGLIK